MYEFRLPDVGEGIHEAVIVNWLVSVGDEVTLDQPIVEIETDKALVEIPAPAAGVIVEIPIGAGTLARVGDLLVIIRSADAAQGKAATKQKPAVSEPVLVKQPESDKLVGSESVLEIQRESNKTEIVPATAGIAESGRRILAAPVVRKRALETGVDLSQVRGSAPAGRITMPDLEIFLRQLQTSTPRSDITPESSTAMAGQEPEPLSLSFAADHNRDLSSAQSPVVISEPLQGLRKRIAERMTQSWRIPHVTSFDQVSVQRLVKLRNRLNESGLHPHLTYLPFIIKAVIQALKDQPYFNACLDIEQQEIRVHQRYHIGIATAIEQGLVVPVLQNADQLSLLEIQAELQHLAELARTRKLNPSQLSGSTFTITNYGSFQGQGGTPIINPPESAILGCGRIEDAAVVIRGKPKSRPVLPLALSFDHRLHDGAAAARFLNQVKALLADPGRFLLYLR